jgi:hypothetical protein
MRGAPKTLVCQVTTRTKNVIKDTEKNLPKIGIYDIFLLKLYYKQLTPTTERQDPNDTIRIHLPNR